MSIQDYLIVILVIIIIVFCIGLPFSQGRKTKSHVRKEIDLRAFDTKQNYTIVDLIYDEPNPEGRINAIREEDRLRICKDNAAHYFAAELGKIGAITVYKERGAYGNRPTYRFNVKIALRDEQ
jgi:hypothetical protein